MYWQGVAWKIKEAGILESLSFSSCVVCVSFKQLTVKVQPTRFIVKFWALALNIVVQDPVAGYTDARWFYFSRTKLFILTLWLIQLNFLMLPTINVFFMVRQELLFLIRRWRWTPFVLFHGNAEGTRRVVCLFLSCPLGC